MMFYADICYHWSTHPRGNPLRQEALLGDPQMYKEKRTHHVCVLVLVANTHLTPPPPTSPKSWTHLCIETVCRDVCMISYHKCPTMGHEPALLSYL